VRCKVITSREGVFWVLKRPSKNKVSVKYVGFGKRLHGDIQLSFDFVQQKQDDVLQPPDTFHGL